MVLLKDETTKKNHTEGGKIFAGNSLYCAYSTICQNFIYQNLGV
jgi:hypothetical protein